MHFNPNSSESLFTAASASAEKKKREVNSKVSPPLSHHRRYGGCILNLLRDCCTSCVVGFLVYLTACTGALLWMVLPLNPLSNFENSPVFALCVACSVGMPILLLHCLPKLSNTSTRVLVLIFSLPIALVYWATHGAAFIGEYSVSTIGYAGLVWYLALSSPRRRAAADILCLVYSVLLFTLHIMDSLAITAVAQDIAANHHHVHTNPWYAVPQLVLIYLGARACLTLRDQDARCHITYSEHLEAHLRRVLPDRVVNTITNEVRWIITVDNNSANGGGGGGGTTANTAETVVCFSPSSNAIRSALSIATNHHHHHQYNNHDHGPWWTVRNRPYSPPPFHVHEYKTASVLFADIVGFTAGSATIPAQKLLENLNHLVTHIDRECSRCALEKIKTIGDCYMCCALPEDDDDDTEEDRYEEAARRKCITLLRFSSTITGILKSYPPFPGSSSSTTTPLFHTGVHTGPIIGGMIGCLKTAYDVWGTTVNTAARIQSVAGPGQVLVSQVVFSMVRDHCRFKFAGEKQFKGVVDKMKCYAFVGTSDNDDTNSSPSYASGGDEKESDEI